MFFLLSSFFPLLQNFCTYIYIYIDQQRHNQTKKLKVSLVIFLLFHIFPFDLSLPQGLASEMLVCTWGVIPRSFATASHALPTFWDLNMISWYDLGTFKDFSFHSKSSFSFSFGWSVCVSNIVACFIFFSLGLVRLECLFFCRSF